MKYEVPNPENIGQELIHNLKNGVIDSDSLDMVELIVGLNESFSGDEGDFDAALEWAGGLSEEQRRVFLLREGLTNGQEFISQLFGMPIRITPIVDDELPGEEPGSSGDREPRVPASPSPVTSQSRPLN